MKAERLLSRAIWAVSIDLARAQLAAVRELANEQEGSDEPWYELVYSKAEAAKEKINAMKPIELLALLEELGDE